MVINLTPHPIILRDGDGREMGRLEPSGQSARLTETSCPAGHIQAGTVTVPLETKSYGGVEGLPPAPDGTTFYVVPLLTALAARAAGRDISDLLVPGKQTRDANGTVNGCTTLARLGG